MGTQQKTTEDQRTYPEAVLESVKNRIKKIWNDGISLCPRKKQISI